MSRLLDDLRAVVLACLPTSPFWVPRRFRVLEMASDNRVKLQAVVAALGLPDVLPVSMSPGMAGVWAKLTPGVIVVVQFVDGDPSIPMITHFEGPDGAGFVPVTLYLCAGATGAYPNEHVTTAEAVVSLIAQTLTQLCIQNAGPVIGATLAPLAPTILNAAIPLTATVPVTPYTAAIAGALLAKIPDPTGVAGLASVGLPSVRGA